jgi:hypothetical protein
VGKWIATQIIFGNDLNFSMKAKSSGDSKTSLNWDLFYRRSFDIR